MAVKEMVELPFEELNDYVHKVTGVIERVLEIPDRSIALDVALLDLRDAALAMANWLPERR